MKAALVLIGSAFIALAIVGALMVLAGLNFDRRIHVLESVPPVEHNEDSHELAVRKVDGKLRATCKYEARDETTGVLTCVYRRPK